jgi:predicted nucleotidyltransferase
VNSETISVRLRENRTALEALGVKSLALFGSAARGEAGPGSDLDFLVEFSRPVGLFEFVELRHALEKILQCEVDLVTPDALRESMKTAILEEAIDVTP